MFKVQPQSSLDTVPGSHSHAQLDVNCCANPATENSMPFPAPHPMARPTPLPTFHPTKRQLQTDTTSNTQSHPTPHVQADATSGNATHTAPNAPPGILSNPDQSWWALLHGRGKPDHRHCQLFETATKMCTVSEPVSLLFHNSKRLWLACAAAWTIVGDHIRKAFAQEDCRE